MDENGMRFDEESVEELTRALYQVFTIPAHCGDDDHHIYGHHVAISNHLRKGFKTPSHGKCP